MDLPIERLGLIILAVLVAVGVILFITSGVGTQTTALNETSQNIISNLTEAVEGAR